MDCFVAEPVIGPRDFARAYWLLAMTAITSLLHTPFAKARRPR
jgi:hypothetical protein